MVSKVFVSYTGIRGYGVLESCDCALFLCHCVLSFRFHYIWKGIFGHRATADLTLHYEFFNIQWLMVGTGNTAEQNH